jgi:hypothetical protein
MAFLVASAVVALARCQVLIRDRKQYAFLAALYSCCFLGSLSAVSLTVWPAGGPWSTDWSGNLSQLEALLRGVPLSGWLLARPPLFAASAVPAYWLLNALPALQVTACAFAATGLVAMLWFADEFQERGEAPIATLLVVGLSTFYLVNLTSIVPKFIQGTLIVSGFVVLKRASIDQLASRVMLAALLIGLAVEVHQSTAAYTLAVGALLWHAARHRIPAFFRLSLLSLSVVLLVVGLPELLRIVRFGWEEVIRFNPSVAMRSSMPAWLLFLLNLESIFVGWAYLLPAWNIIKVATDHSLSTILYYVNWFVLVHLGMTCNTLLLIIAPFVFTWARLRSFVAFVSSRTPLDITLGVVTVPIFAALLIPYLTAQGDVHAGATALAIGGLALGMAWLGSAPARLRGSLLVTVAAETIWWVGWKAFQYVEVIYGRTHLTFDQNDSDPSLLLASGQTPWGHGMFPLLPLVLAVLTVLAATIVAWLARWRSVAASSHQQICAISNGEPQTNAQRLEI